MSTTWQPSQFDDFGMLSNYEIVKNILNFRKQEIEETIEQHILVNDIQGAINSLDYYLEIAHKGGKVILACNDSSERAI